jgi:signal transduction histidine kinase
VISGANAKELFAGGGEMGALMRDTDWSKTELGPIEGWPSSLRTMLGAVLGSRFPMLLWWGPDLLQLYNDGYRSILRDKHPASLAAPAAKVWAEIWDVVGPMVNGVMAGGPATWTEDLQLFINRGGLAEETYFTFSYSPVPGDDGRVGSVLNTVQETTAKVQSERQIRMLHDLGARAAEAKSEEAAYRIAAEVLSANELDLPFVLLYVTNDKADCASLVSVSGAGGWQDYVGPAKPASILIDGGASAETWPVGEALRTAREVIVEDLAGRFGPLPLGSWSARPERAIVLPLSRAGQSTPYAVLIAGISPHRAFDDRYQRFFRASADQAMAAIANARAYEQERRRAEKLAELDAAKTAFFNNISHEFRTPLTLMLGPLEDCLAQTTPALPPEQRTRVGLAHDNALRLLKLVNALLDFARLEAGRLRASYAPLDIAGFTAELAGMFQSAVERADLRLVVDCPPLSQPVWVDRDMWEKIVPNLVANAFKFTLAGEIAVRVREDDTRVVLEVADTGVGIPADELPRVFERFHRVAGNVGRTHEGTGIGLALVRELVSLHGGEVTVDSAVGRGSTFRVALPKGFAHLPPELVAQAPADARGGRDAAAHAAEAGHWTGGALGLSDAKLARPEIAATGVTGPASGDVVERTRPYVLVVDDNADLRAYVAGLLAPRYEVSVAVDGQAALESVVARRPDLVVSDVMMPRLDGFGLLRALRAEPASASVPVILLSARAGEEAAIEGLDAGADDYLVKPFSARELLARAHTHLELARARRAWIAELERANAELDAFSYSVSHDLRAPLRAIDGFAQLVVKEYGATLDDRARHYLERVRAGTGRMAVLIDDLLSLSRVSRAPLRREMVNLSALARQIATELARREPARAVDCAIAEGLMAQADGSLVAVVLENLLGNAWKFTAKCARARIVLAREERGGESWFCVRDNGAGFDMAYASKLFAPFQRLHPSSEFEGTGIGLATVQRVIARHHGRIFAEGAVGEGAAFFFALEARA